MSLATAERRRLFKRRVTRLVLAIVVLVLGLMVVSFSVSSHKRGPSHIAAAEVARVQQYESMQQHFARDRADCEESKRRGDNSRFPSDVDCEQIRGPQLEDMTLEQFLPYQFNFREEFGQLIMVFAGLLTLFAFVVGASYVGAEWHSGAMMNLLLWRPRRVPVLLTKLGTLLGAITLIGVLLGGLWTLAFWLIARFTGVTGTLTTGVWESFAISGARAIGLALIAGAVGFALASFGRHTAMALGAAVGVVVVGEIGLRIVLELIRVTFADRYVLSTYVIAWIDKRYQLIDYSRCDFDQGVCEPAKMTITWQDSALVFGVATVLTVGAAIWSMHRRDVT